MKPEDYTWGLGLEHELHLFHIPKTNSKEGIKDIILFDSESAIKRLIEDAKKKKIKLKDSEINFLEGIPLELSGRFCNKVAVLERVPIKMPELITWKPFCSILENRKTYAIQEIKKQKERLVNLLKKDKLTKELCKKYGDLDEYPFGMTRFLKYGPIKNNEYIFKKDPKTGYDKVHTDYTGSYHVTITMPHTKDISEEEFIKIHQNFANQLQWIEPILMIGFFSGDEYAPGSKKDRTRGSFRVMNVGWGNFAGSDIRLFKTGLGRYAKTHTYWRDNFKLEGSEKLKPCYKPSPAALKEGGITSLSTDFRTFGDNPKGERVSGYKMMKPNGIEFRIFDNFDDAYLDNLLLIIFLVMQNSFDYQTKSYVYQNKIWINELHHLMRNGYSAEVSKGYIKSIEKHLDIKLKMIENENICNCLLEALYKKNKNGFYMKLLYSDDEILNKNFDIKRYYSKINEYAWNYAFLLKLNRQPKVMNKLNQFIHILDYLDKLSVKKAIELLLIVFGQEWRNDILNILMFMKNEKLIDYKNLTTKKNLIKVNKKIIHEFNSQIVNEYINDYYVGIKGFKKKLIVNRITNLFLQNNNNK